MDEVVENFFLWKNDTKLLKNLFLENSIADLQDRLVERTLGSELNSRFPVNPEHGLRFCKNVIQAVEKTNGEVSENLYESLQYLLQLAPSSQPRFFKSYFVGDTVVSLLEATQIIR